MPRKKIELTCVICGRSFLTSCNNAKYCLECREKYQAEVKKDIAHRSYFKRKIALHNPHPERKTIWDVMRELENYNRTNGTYLTYGQYVLRTEILKGGKKR